MGGNKRDLGLDIGYGNLKVAFHDGDSLVTQVFPAGAAPVEYLPTRIGDSQGDYSIVLLGDVKWAAGVDPSTIQNWERDLHQDYCFSESYRALFLASLLMTGVEQVDCLVTGLPMDQSLDRGLREALASRLTGTHQVTEKKKVTVKSVRVIPQPLGAYFDLIQGASKADMEFYGDARILVLDPGFGSVDWVVIDPDGNVRQQSAGTSPHAVSAVLERASFLIGEDHGQAPSRDRLDQAVRRGAPSIVLGKERIDHRPYLAKAAQEVAPTALTRMRQTLRTENRDPDVILVTGGGAEMYGRLAEGIFPNARVVVPELPVLANARGFCHATRL